jgi:hypothetical protein
MMVVGIEPDRARDAPQIPRSTNTPTIKTNQKADIPSRSAILKAKLLGSKALKALQRHMQVDR